MMEIDPADYISLPITKQVACHVCGSVGCASMRRGGGEYLCSECLGQAEAKKEQERIAALPRHPVVVVVRAADELWHNKLAEIERPTFGIRHRWRLPIRAALKAANGHAHFDEGGVLWLVFALDAPVADRIWSLCPWDEMPAEVADLLEDLPNDIPPVRQADFAAFMEFILQDPDRSLEEVGSSSVQDAPSHETDQTPDEEEVEVMEEVMEEVTEDPGPPAETPVPPPLAAEGVDETDEEEDIASYGVSLIRGGRAMNYVNANLDDLVSTGSKGQMVPNFSGIAWHIARLLCTVSFNNRLWIYTDEGVYRQDKGEVRRVLKLIVDELADITLGEHGGDPPKNSKISAIDREVRYHLLATNTYSDYPFDRAHWMIPVANGVVRIDPESRSVDLVPHSPDHLFTYRLPITYDPDADPSALLEVFEAWVGEEHAACLVQLPAVAFLQQWVGALKIAYLFEGPHDAGKSTYCELLYALFGRGAYSEVSLQALTFNRFAAAGLEGKLINISDDLEAIPMNSLGTFIQLTGSVFHSVERKGQDSYETVLTAPHIFTCNRPPQLKKDIDNQAFWSRWVYLIWPNRFERDNDFKRRLFTADNMSACLNLVVGEILAYLNDRTHLKRMAPEEVQTLWVQATDEVFRFVSEHFDRAPDSWIPKDRVYEAYVRFCDREQVTARPKNSLSVALSRLRITGSYRTDPATRKRVHVYSGIQWKEGCAQELKKPCTPCTDDLSDPEQANLTFEEDRESGEGSVQGVQAFSYPLTCEKSGTGGGTGSENSTYKGLEKACTVHTDQQDEQEDDEQNPNSEKPCTPCTPSNGQISEVIPEGARRETIAGIVRTLTWAEYPPDRIADLVAAINRDRCTPPLPNDVVMGIVRSGGENVES